jgi:hypothetical protein
VVIARAAQVVVQPNSRFSNSTHGHETGIASPIE